MSCERFRIAGTILVSNFNAHNFSGDGFGQGGRRKKELFFSPFPPPPPLSRHVSYVCVCQCKLVLPSFFGVRGRGEGGRWRIASRRRKRNIYHDAATEEEEEEEEEEKEEGEEETHNRMENALVGGWGNKARVKLDHTFFSFLSLPQTHTQKKMEKATSLSKEEIS